MIPQDRVKIRVQSINRHPAALLEALAHNADPDTQQRIVEMIRSDRRLRESGAIENAIRQEAEQCLAEDKQSIDCSAELVRAVYASSGWDYEQYAAVNPEARIEW